MSKSHYKLKVDMASEGMTIESVEMAQKKQSSLIPTKKALPSKLVTQLK